MNICIVLIPTFVSAVTVEMGMISNFLDNCIKYSIILGIIIWLILSYSIAIIIEKNEKHKFKKIILPINIIMLVFFIVILVINMKLFSHDYIIGKIFIMVLFISNIIQIINMKYDTKRKKISFIFFSIVALIYIIVIIICGSKSIEIFKETERSWHNINYSGRQITQ